MRTHRIAAIGGDGGGSGLLSASLEMLAASAQRDGRFRLDIACLDRDSDGGAATPADPFGRLQAADAILLTARSCGGADGLFPAMWRWTIGKRLDHAVTIRPVRILRGLHGPLRHISEPRLDWLIVGDNLGAARSGEGERASADTNEETATDIVVSTRARVERILRHAFQTARSRLRKRLTVVTGAHPLSRGLAMWSQTATEVAQGYPDVVWDHTPVHMMTLRMTRQPETLDTIVTSNPHTDMLSGWAAALAGPPDVFASANFNLEGRAPAMFEPLQGSALGMTSEGEANPIATFWAGAMMLNHLGENDSAARLMRAIENATADSTFQPPGQGSHATTDEATKTICALIRGDDG